MHSCYNEANGDFSGGGRKSRGGPNRKVSAVASFHETKHIERRHLKIRELVLDAILRVQYVASKDNIADIFTKPLDKKTFITLRTKLLNLPRKEAHWA